MAERFPKTGPVGKSIESSNFSQEEMRSLECVITKKLGQGAFGDVYAGKRRNEAGEWKDVAVKVVFPSYENKEDYVKEIEIVDTCHHPSLIKTYDIVRKKDKEGNEVKCLYFMELAKQDLGSYIESKGGSGAGEEDGKRIMSQIASGLHFLHIVHKVAHRDIKAENVLLFNDGRAVLADFSFSTKTGWTGRSTDLCGTPMYMSPEMLRAQEYGSAGILGHSPYKDDIWAFGMLTYFLVNGDVPYESLNKHIGLQVRNFLQQDADEGRYGDELLDLFKGTLAISGGSRFDADQLTNHQWFGGNVTTADCSTCTIQ